MLESDGNELDRLSFAQRHGAALNKKGDIRMEKKLAVAETYGGRPSLSKIASEHKVDRRFVRKIESELYANEGCVVSPEEVTLDMVSLRRLGPGSIVLDQAGCFALYCLFRRKPTRSLQSYVHELYRHRGTRVSTSVVSRFFNHAFEICGGLCVPNLVLYDKFRPHNIKKAVEYIKALARIDPSRLKYADEKSLKGKDIHNKLSRWDPLTGMFRLRWLIWIYGIHILSLEYVEYHGDQRRCNIISQNLRLMLSFLHWKSRMQLHQGSCVLAMS